MDKEAKEIRVKFIIETLVDIINNVEDLEYELYDEDKDRVDEVNEAIKAIGFEDTQVNITAFVEDED